MNFNERKGKSCQIAPWDFDWLSLDVLVWGVQPADRRRVSTVGVCIIIDP